MSVFFAENVQELGSQVPDFLLVRPLQIIPHPCAEVEKVKSVSGNLMIGPKTFCKNEGVRHKKHAFCP